MRNIALRLKYDGSAYHGWQVQKTDVSVAETVEKALAKVVKHPVRVVGCGRTDAGVHALRYCANFHTDCAIPAEKLPLAAVRAMAYDPITIPILSMMPFAASRTTFMHRRISSSVLPTAHEAT